MHPSIHAKNSPDHPAYIIAETSEVVTYSQLDKSSNQGAQLFRSLGLEPGDHVALMMENNHHYMKIIWAAQRAGLVFTTVSSHLKADEVAYIVDNCDAKVFIASVRLQAIADELFDELSDDIHCFMVNGSTRGYASWEEKTAQQVTTPIGDECAGTQMLYSSGTTGVPKGIYPVMGEARSITEKDPTMTLLVDAFKISDKTVYLSPAPLYHAAPLIYNLLVMYQGGTSVIMEKFDPEICLQLIEKHKINTAQFVPIMFVRMLKLDQSIREKYDTSSMRLAIHAAAPCPEEIKKTMIDWWGPILVEYYSSSEAAGTTILNTEQWLTHQGSVGMPLGCEIHIVGENGEEVAVGEVGDVYFSNTKGVFEYYKEPEKTAETRNDKGWVTVGDMGRVDEDGYLYLTDRKKFMIISGGVNIYPQEVENLMVSHEKVADIAVFGVPCEEFGEKVQAVVQPAHWSLVEEMGEEALEAELVAWCKERLSGVKTPRSFDFMRVLPRLDNGKLYKRKLFEQYNH